MRKSIAVYAYIYRMCENLFPVITEACRMINESDEHMYQNLSEHFQLPPFKSEEHKCNSLLSSRGSWTRSFYNATGNSLKLSGATDYREALWENV